MAATTTSSRVSSAAAHEALRLVKKRFSMDLQADRWHARTFRTGARCGPVLVRDYEPYWGGGKVPYAILWEDGPSEWVYSFLWESEGRPEVQDVFFEAGTSFILLLFPAM